MEEKIKLYEEMLALDPGSKLFFSLAKLYRQNNEPGKAISTLNAGLEKHPEHIEARLLLCTLLVEQGKDEEVRDSLTAVGNVLENYPDFWSSWAEKLEKEGRKDLAIALRFVGYNLSGSDLGWSDILYNGFREMSEPGTTSGPDNRDQVEQQQEDSAEQEDASIYMQEASQLAKTGESQYRTKTMADILADQGDYSDAIDIYQELHENTADKEEKKKLQQIIDKIKGEQTAQEDTNEQQAGNKKQKIVDRMSSLAERLEARGV